MLVHDHHWRLLYNALCSSKIKTIFLPFLTCSQRVGLCINTIDGIRSHFENNRLSILRLNKNSHLMTCLTTSIVWVIQSYIFLFTKKKEMRRGNDSTIELNAIVIDNYWPMKSFGMFQKSEISNESNLTFNSINFNEINGLIGSTITEFILWLRDIDSRKYSTHNELLLFRLNTNLIDTV